MRRMLATQSPSTRRISTRAVVLLAAVAILGAGCDRGAQVALTTTTTDPATEATSATATGGDTGTATTTADGSTATTSVVAAVPVEDYQVAATTSAPEGRLMWVVVPPADYTSRDLENFVVGVVEENQGLWELHVVDDADAADAARIAAAERTDAEQALVDSHLLLSLTEGTVITFQGPYQEMGSFTLGS